VIPYRALWKNLLKVLPSSLSIDEIRRINSSFSEFLGGHEIVTYVFSFKYSEYKTNYFVLYTSLCGNVGYNIVLNNFMPTLFQRKL